MTSCTVGQEGHCFLIGVLMQLSNQDVLFFKTYFLVQASGWSRNYIGLTFINICSRWYHFVGQYKKTLFSANQIFPAPTAIIISTKVRHYNNHKKIKNRLFHLTSSNE